MKDCYSIARNYRSGKRGVVEDRKRAFELFGRACALTKPMDDMGCREQAYMLREGEGVPQDEAKALEMHKSLCDRGIGGHCNSAATLLTKPRQIERDEAAAIDLRKRAEALLESSCARDNARDCNSLGGMHVRKQVAQPSLKRAYDAVRRSCELKYPNGCDSLAFMFLNGAGVAKDEAEALRLFTIGCRADIGYSCLARGFMLQLGRGTPADEAAARAAFGQACMPLLFRDADQNCQRDPAPTSCGMGALMAAMGVCTAKDLDKARELAKLACAPPFTWYCERVAEVEKQG